MRTLYAEKEHEYKQKEYTCEREEEGNVPLKAMQDRYQMATQLQLNESNNINI